MGGFLAELRRRHIFRIGAVYVVVAWGIIQVLDVLSQLFALPDWIAQPAVVVLAIGFPVTLIAAWMIVGAADVGDPARSLKATGTDWVLASALIAVLVVLGYQRLLPTDNEATAIAELNTDPVTSDLAQSDEPSGPIPNSLAVLPFENLSPDPDNAYYAASIHTALLNELFKIRDVRAISRASVLRYADGLTPPSQIAQELNVETVMVGTVQYDQGRILVTAQLIDPETEIQLWSENYDREFEGIFEIQANIATNIAMALEAELLPSELERISTPVTQSPQAYALYLEYLDRNTLGRFRLDEDSHRILDEAIELDPDFALAYAEKAARYAADLIFVEEDDLSETERLIHELSEKALELDPNLGFAYWPIAQVHRRHWREAEALGAFERAMQLSPNDPELLIRFAEFDYLRGEFSAAMEKARAALQVDPLSSLAASALCYAYLLSKNPDEAKRAFLHAISLSEVSQGMTLIDFGIAEVMRGNDAAALPLFQLGEAAASASREDENPGYTARTAYAYGQIGRTEDAVRLVNDLEALAASGIRVGPIQYAIAYLGAGDLSRSLEWFNDAIENRDTPSGGAVITVQVVQNFLSDPVLEQPEFREIRSKLGFVD